MKRRPRDRAGGRKRADVDERVEQEMLIQAVGEALAKIMADEQLDKTRLAERLHKSTADVCQLLRGDRNLTLRNVARLAYAMGHRARVYFEPLATGGGLLKPVDCEMVVQEPWELDHNSMRQRRAGVG